MSPSVLLFIPAYNCEKQIPRVIEKIDPRVQSLISEVVVIENRSTDGTLEAARVALSQLSLPTTLLQNKENYSLGGSIKAAFLYAASRGYDYLITLHGDDQADIRDLIPVLGHLGETHPDLVIGARFHPDSTLEGYSLVRRWGNRVLGAAFGLVARQRIYDLIAGINVFRVGFFTASPYLNFPNNLTFDAHMLLYSINTKARLEYVPITWREEDQVSNAKTVKQALTILRLLGSYVVLGSRVFERNKSGRPDGFTYPSDVVAAQRPAAREDD